LIQSGKDGVAVHLGTWISGSVHLSSEKDPHADKGEPSDVLRTALYGMFSRVEIEPISTNGIEETVKLSGEKSAFRSPAHIGFALGIPSVKASLLNSGGSVIDRLVRSLLGSYWNSHKKRKFRCKAKERKRGGPKEDSNNSE